MQPGLLRDCQRMYEKARAGARIACDAAAQLAYCHRRDGLLNLGASLELAINAVEGALCLSKVIQAIDIEE